MELVSLISSKIDFLGEAYFWMSLHEHFVIILKFIFTLIFRIQIHEKNPWHQELTIPVWQPRQYLSPTALELNNYLGISM